MLSDGAGTFNIDVDCSIAIAGKPAPTGFASMSGRLPFLNMYLHPTVVITMNTSTAKAHLDLSQPAA